MKSSKRQNSEYSSDCGSRDIRARSFLHRSARMRRLEEFTVDVSEQPEVASPVVQELLKGKKSHGQIMKRSSVQRQSMALKDNTLHSQHSMPFHDAKLDLIQNSKAKVDRNEVLYSAKVSNCRHRLKYYANNDSTVSSNQKHPIYIPKYDFELILERINLKKLVKAHKEALELEALQLQGSNSKNSPLHKKRKFHLQSKRGVNYIHKPTSKVSLREGLRNPLIFKQNTLVHDDDQNRSVINQASMNNRLQFKQNNSPSTSIQKRSLKKNVYELIAEKPPLNHNFVCTDNPHPAPPTLSQSILPNSKSSISGQSIDNPTHPHPKPNHHAYSNQRIASNAYLKQKTRKNQSLNRCFKSPFNFMEYCP